MKVELVKPQGYCAGVLNAINIATKAKEENIDKKIYVLGMLVHNEFVINDLTAKGIETLNIDNEIPDFIKEGDVIIFTAHGHSERLEIEARNRNLIIYDCTCPIVRKNLNLIKNELKENHQIIYIGQKGHKETNAALSLDRNVILYDTKSSFNYSTISDESPFIINQTTLNFLSIKNIHNEILSNITKARITDEICNATRLRQEAILSIDDSTDLIIIVGDTKSSNTHKLLEIAEANFLNAKSFLVSSVNDLSSINLCKYKKAAIASGASTPSTIVEEIQNYLLNY